uniref:Uncharacterized protein n=1 Tax=Magallana gigas TaxID=29159 RepID=A0A8W8MIG7_MAGGI
MPPKKKPNERKKRELERQKKQIKRNNKPDIKCCSVSSFANINPVNHNSTDSRVPEEIITAESTSVDCAETSFQLDDGIGVQVHNEPPPASVQEQYSAVLTAVQEELAKLKPDEKISLDELLQRASMLEDDDADVFMTGILEYYAARPSKLSEMTLAEFASKYKKSSNKTLDKSDEKKIQLQGGFGVMSQREFGAFATQSFMKGEFLLEYVEYRLTPQEAEPRIEKGRHNYMFYFTWNGNMSAVGGFGGGPPPVSLACFCAALKLFLAHCCKLPHLNFTWSTVRR